MSSDPKTEELIEVKPQNSSSEQDISEGQFDVQYTHLSSFRWGSPFVQMLWCSAIVGCTAGLYCATNGLGAGGGKPGYAQVANIDTAIGDVLWLFSSLFAGTLINKLGPNVCMVLGSLAYPMYISGFWFYDKLGIGYYSYLVSGVAAGILFGFLWTTQNYLVTCYATENHKGFFVACNWGVINLGAALGSVIAIGVSKDKTERSAGVPWYLYLIFIIINLGGAVMAIFLKHPKNVVRNDGSKIAVFQNRTLKENLVALKQSLMERRIQLMILPLFSAETILAPAANLNGFMFNVRSRTLNNFSFWAVQIPGAFALYFLLDQKGKSRKMRGYMGLGLTYFFVNCFFIGFYIMYGAWGKAKFDPASPESELPDLDWSMKTYAGPYAWYVCGGIAFGLFLDMRLWIIGAFSNDPQKLSLYSGVIPACQAGGIALAFGLNATSLSFTSIMAIWYVFYMASLPCLILCIKWYITDTNYFAEQDVIVPQEAILDQKEVRFRSI